MSAPSGKGIFLRGPGIYPGGDPGAYAESIGADWVAIFASATPDALIARIAARFRGNTYLYEHPGTPWRPDAHRATALRLSELASRLRLRGVIFDPEDGWTGSRPADVEALARSMQVLVANGLDVGVTTFPAWPQRETLAAKLAELRLSVWAAPQIYPAGPSRLSSAERVAWIERWRALLVVGRGRGYADIVPAFGAWGMTADELRAHLSELGPVRSGLIWHTSGRAGPLTTVLAEWSPGSPFAIVRRLLGTAGVRLRQGAEAIAGDGAPAMMLALGAALVLLVAVAWWHSRRR